MSWVITTNVKEGELKTDGWPEKLTVQLIPKRLITMLGSEHFKNSKLIYFHPQNCGCEDVQSLTKAMSAKFVSFFPKTIEFVFYVFIIPGGIGSFSETNFKHL